MKQYKFNENPPTINRNALVVVPTEHFLEWAKKIPYEDDALTLEELVADSTAYLTPEQDANADRWLKRNFKTIFEIELDGWCTDQSLWLEDRSYKIFKEFFHIHYCSSVLDMGDGPIDREYI